MINIILFLNFIKNNNLNFNIKCCIFVIKNIMNNTLINNLYNSLNKEERYDCTTQLVWSYKKVTDIIDNIQLNLSNMAGGFPFMFNEIEYKSNEILYLMGEFSNSISLHQDIQKEMQDQKSGFAAKRFVKSKYKEYIRSDFEEFRVEWMLFVVWQKCIGNENFRKKLLEIPNNVILVEDTTTDKSISKNIWGASNKELNTKRQEVKKQIVLKNTTKTKKALEQLISIEINKIRNIGVFEGQNNMGKILMLCKECIKNNINTPINTKLLNSKDIYINNKLIIF